MTPSINQLTPSVKLITVNTDKFKTGALRVSVAVPYSGRNTVYNMLLSNILDRGTEKFPGITALSKRYDELYATSIGINGNRRLGKNIFLTFTSDPIDDKYVPDGTDILSGILEIIEGMLFSPKLEGGLFPEDTFLQEKKFFADSIDASINNTKVYANLRLQAMAFANDKENLSIEAIKDILNEIDNKSLVEYLENTVRTSPLEIFYAGSISEDKLSEKILSRFSKWNATGESKINLPTPEPLCEYKSLTETMPVSQGKLAMGFKVGVCIKNDSREHFAAFVFNEIFGGSPASKLFMNVREKLSLCYYCSSAYNQYSGMIAVQSGIDNKNRELAEKAILSELEDIRMGKISDVELFAAKQSLINTAKQLYDSVFDTVEFIGNRLYFGIEETVEDQIRGISDVTAEDVIAIAKNTVCDSVFYVEGIADTEEDETDE